MPCGHGSTTHEFLSFIVDIESYELGGGVNISSGVRSFTSSGLVVMSNADSNSSCMSGLLTLGIEDVINYDSGNTSLNIGSVVSIVR